MEKSDCKDCETTIKKFTEIPDTIVTKIGEIKLGESGFAMSCSEEHALKILQDEAYALNADLIIITEENRPDLWSSCYRCSANFYRYLASININHINNNEAYEVSKVKQRVSDDRNQNTVVAILAVAVGFALGFLLFQ